VGRGAPATASRLKTLIPAAQPGQGPAGKVFPAVRPRGTSPGQIDQRAWQPAAGDVPPRRRSRYHTPASQAVGIGVTVHGVVVKHGHSPGTARYKSIDRQGRDGHRPDRKSGASGWPRLRQRRRLKLPQRRCAHCDKWFQPQRRAQRYCSRRCRWTGQKRQQARKRSKKHQKGK